jgi:hypothetical protein
MSHRKSDLSRTNGATAHLLVPELTSRNLEDLETLGLGDQVDGTTRRHTPGESLDSTVGLAEVRDGLLRPVRDDRNRVRGGDESTGTVNHVPVTISVGSGTEHNVPLLNLLDELVGVSQVGVRVVSTEIGLGVTVLNRVLAQSEKIDEDGLSIRSSNSAKGVEEDGRLGRAVQVGLDLFEIKDFLEQVEVVLDLVDDLDLDGSVSELTDLGQVELRQSEDMISTKLSTRLPSPLTSGKSTWW